MSQPNLPAVPAEDLDDGLEDFEGGLSLPRLTLRHKIQVFQDSATNEEYPELVGVLLGMVRQRVFWNPEIGEEKARPRCKSSDGKLGFPNMKDTDDNGFPWDEFPTLPDQLPKDEYGRPTIACDGCVFAEWTKDKKGKPKPPPCSERYSFPILYNREGNPEGELDGAGVFALQGSGIKPARTYMSAFKASKQPLYGAVTRVSLRAASRGQVEYSIPEFKREGNTPVEEWANFSEQLRGVKEYLKAPPRPDSDEVSNSVPQGSEPVAPTTTKNDDVVDAVVVETSNVPTPAATEDDLPF